MKKEYIYATDIHGNYAALKYIKELEEFNDDNCEFRFGGDYIDGFNLEKGAVEAVLKLIKELCDSGKAQAIIGNHDEFIIDATYAPGSPRNSWESNGREETLKSFGIPYSSDDDLSVQLLYNFGDYIEWLNSLPLVIEDGNNILTHAGFRLTEPLEGQSRATLLWIRESYYDAEKRLKEEFIHEDYKGKTLITGHTPTGIFYPNYLSDCPIVKKDSLGITRYLIDGGSKGYRYKSGKINLLKLDEDGNEIWRKYLTEKGIFDYS